MMKLHVVSETSYLTKGQGVHTAFMEHVALMKEKKDIEVVINEEGWGDVFHSHTYGPYYFWKGRKYKGKRIFTVHVIPESVKGSFPVWQMWLPFVKLYLRKVFSYADVCIAISPHVEKAIEELGARTHVELIPNPILTDHWKRTDPMRKSGRNRLGLSENDFLVLGVGQLEGRKGVDDFIEIARAMPGLKFAWVGGRPFGLMTEGVRRLNKKIANAPPNLQFTGLLNLSVMPEMYAAGDLFLFPSFQENCPLAPLEAAASGMPVIFRDLDEYKSLYENPYLKAKSIEDFITLTNKMKTDKDLYRQGKEISMKLIQQFDKDNIRKKLITLYRRVADDQI